MRLWQLKDLLNVRRAREKRARFFRHVEVAESCTVEEEKRDYRIHYPDGCSTQLPKTLFWYGNKSQERDSRARLRVGKATYLQDARVGPFWQERSVSIGAFCSFGPRVDIRLDGVRGLNQFTTYPLELIDPESRLYRQNVEALRTLRVEIGNDCFVGESVKIMQNVTVGDGVVIGARSLVAAGKTLEPYGVYAGSPARLVRHRFDPQLVEELLRVQWWHWDRARIAATGLQHVDFVQERDRALDLLRAL